MARVTVEDCLKKVDSRFSLVHLAAKRVRQLREGAPPFVQVKNKEMVVSLREVATGDVYPVTADEAEKGRMESEARERERLEAMAAARAAAETESDAEGEEPA